MKTTDFDTSTYIKIPMVAKREPGTGILRLNEKYKAADASDNSESDYAKYRGKCKEFSEAAVAEDPTLTLVRGYYYCPITGKQQHWWCKRADGSIYDPTVKQFPSKGMGEYEEFDGWIECAMCGKSVHESEAHFNGNYACCSYTCGRKLVGV